MTAEKRKIVYSTSLPSHQNCEVFQSGPVLPDVFDVMKSELIEKNKTKRRKMIMSQYVVKEKSKRLQMDIQIGSAIIKLIFGPGNSKSKQEIFNWAAKAFPERPNLNKTFVGNLLYRIRKATHDIVISSKDTHKWGTFGYNGALFELLDLWEKNYNIVWKNLKTLQDKVMGERKEKKKEANLEPSSSGLQQTSLTFPGIKKVTLTFEPATGNISVIIER